MSEELNNFYGLFLQNGRYENEFIEESCRIGQGAFGIVAKSRNKVSKKCFAIKKLIIPNAEEYDKKMREIVVWAELDCEYFVSHKSCWLEKYKETDKNKFLEAVCTHKKEKDKAEFYGEFKTMPFAILHIEMELCSFSLLDAIAKIKQYFNIEENALLSDIPYYIMSELFKEILISIKFMHNKGIIHRDLKPANFLIKHAGNNDKFIKVGDFGLSVIDNNQTHTKGAGTLQYMAPEVNIGGKYDTKADVYSIGIMIMDLFNFNIYRLKNNLTQKYENMVRMAEFMSKNKNMRATCGEIYELKSQWAMDYNDIKNEVHNRFDLSANYDIDNDFVPYFLKVKDNYNNQGLEKVSTDVDMSPVSS